MPDDDIPDATPDDSYSDGDELVDWSQVDKVAEHIAAIQAIQDPARRLEAAKRWVVELG
jgi:hypothetical protein